MANIPIFIPHQGCKRDCVFCNQRSITGQNVMPTIEETDMIIKTCLKTMTKKPQIAFFGGSFTGIGNDLMEGYLSVAHKYVKNGQAMGIRLSTRPDYIDSEILSILKKYGVTNIELGAQSLCDDVLEASNRGHDALCVEKASKAILSENFTLGLQMMIGLPCDTREKSVYTAKKIAELGARETRIYPTVVIEGTRLADMYKKGEYVPMDFDEAISAAAECYSIFFEKGVNVLRIGLQNSEELKKSVVGGFYHDSIGELVYSRVIRNSVKKNGTICYNKRFLSKVLGQKKENMEYFKKNGLEVKLKEDNSINGVLVDGKYVLTI
ncbi:MAG: elongator complex protein 3 [Clostridia bacterium]